MIVGSQFYCKSVSIDVKQGMETKITDMLNTEAVTEGVL